MKKTLLAIAIVVLTASAQPTFAGSANTSPFYFEVQLGGSKQTATGVMIADVKTPDLSSSPNFESALTKADITRTLNVGFDFNSAFYLPVRLELAVANRPAYSHVEIGQNDMGTTSITKTTTNRMPSVMANVYLDFFANSPLSLYITAGYGVAIPDISVENVITTTTAWGSDTEISVSHKKSKQQAWIAGTGLNFTITDHLKADLSARYIKTGNVFVDDSDEPLWDKMESIDVLLGLRYNF